MEWSVEICEEFAPEIDAMGVAERRELLAYAQMLKVRGPALSRPFADTLKGSKIKNLKELRFVVDKHEWRVAFAFDPERRAILLVSGDKTGVVAQRFYKTLIAVAEKRYAAHLERSKDVG